MRARNLKPSFFTNDELCEISPLGRLLFQGLWCLSDRAGRLEDRPKRIKAEVLPYDDCDANALLQMLNSGGFITRYEANGRRYIQVVNFQKHQNPHVKEPESTIPAPDKHSASTIQEPDKNGSSRADSGFRTPPSGLPLPDSRDCAPNGALSGSPPDDAPKPASKVNGSGQKYVAEAKAVLTFLNEKAGRRFPPTDANVGIIVARFKEGFTPEQLRQVVANRVRKWKGDEQMAEYLRPETLFGRKKFSSYVGELVPEEDGDA